MRADRDNILWITNIPTPYTVPVWRALSKDRILRVACLAETEANRQWKVDLSGLTVEFLNGSTVRLPGGHRVFGPNAQLGRLVARHPEAVIIDGWESIAAIQAALHARMKGSKLLLSYWSTVDSHRYSSGPIAVYRRSLFRSVDAVITPGERATQAVLRMGVTRERIYEGFAAVDVQAFNQRARAHRETLAPGRGHNYVFVGQLIERKNVAGLLHAFAQVAVGEDRLTIAGSGHLETALRQKTAELGLGDRVHFAGYLDMCGLIELYAHSHTLVLPSTEEVWGLVVNEALAAGMHAVVTDVCGVSTSVCDMPGVIVTSTDKGDLANALAKSRREWVGYIDDSPILAHTPEAFSSRISEAIANVGRRRHV